MTKQENHSLFQPFELPCGAVLQNHIVKLAMSDSLGDGRRNPTQAQLRLYERWASSGIAASIVGEVQCSPHYAEKPGNLALQQGSEIGGFKELACRGSAEVLNFCCNWDMPGQCLICQ